MKNIYFCCLFLVTIFVNSQTEIDGIMMEKHNFCAGSVYQYSSFNQYWEGSFKRENLNMGTISTKSYAFMGNYGISDKLNAIVSLPYVMTNASAGTMKGQKGFQDFSLTLKYMPYEKEVGNWAYSAYILGGFSVPTTDYVADYLPLSIGLQSKTLTARIMGDVQHGKIYTTFSGAYIRRDNITIDRDAYFTTDYHYTNEVFMPNVFTTNFRLGYRTPRLIADVYFDNWVTQKGGFDITKNNMPFPSNTINMSKIGAYAKYTFKQIKGLSVLGGYNYVTSGRNVGQSTSIDGGLFYVFSVKNKVTKDSNKKQDEK